MLPISQLHARNFLKQPPSKQISTLKHKEEEGDLNE